MHDRAHVEQAEAVRLAAARAPRSLERARRHFIDGQLVAPGGRSGLQPAAGRPLPLGFGRQPPAPSLEPAQPGGVFHGVVPGDADDRLVGIAERGMVPPGRRARGARAQERLVLPAGDGGPAEPEGTDLDLVPGSLVGPAGLRAHEETAAEHARAVRGREG